jgi:hypothetical protein
MRANEFLFESSDDDSIIKDFIDFAADKLNLDKLPKIKLLRNPETASQRRSFGGYSVGQHYIEITVGNRHIMDVLRTLAHEMVHYRQDLNDELNGESGRDGSPQENEANAEAAVIMRQWGKSNPDLFKRAALLAEAWNKNASK